MENCKQTTINIGVPPTPPTRIPIYHSDAKPIDCVDLATYISNGILFEGNPYTDLVSFIAAVVAFYQTMPNIDSVTLELLNKVEEKKRLKILF